MKAVVKPLYERLRKLPWPKLAGHSGDFPLYEALLAGCADRIANGCLLDLSMVPEPDDGTLQAVAKLRAKPSLTDDEREFLEYFALLEEIRVALGGRRSSDV